VSPNQRPLSSAFVTPKRSSFDLFGSYRLAAQGECGIRSLARTLRWPGCHDPVGVNASPLEGNS
jgi:hypothetical protein